MNVKRPLQQWPERLTRALVILRRRIAERFPDSSLGEIAAEVLDLAHHTRARARRVRRPILAVRIGAHFLQVVLLGALVAGLYVLWGAAQGLPSGTSGPLWFGFLEAVEAAVALLLTIGGLSFGLVRFETGLRQSLVLREMQRFRTTLDVIDMHQLYKDPTYLLLDTAAMPVRTMSLHQLLAYLGFCSELMTLTSKLASTYAVDITDPLVHQAVDDIQSYAGELVRGIRTKLQLVGVAVSLAPAEARTTAQAFDEWALATAEGLRQASSADEDLEP